MLNPPGAPAPEELANVIDYANPEVAAAMRNGVVNTAADVILSNIRASIRRGHQQVKPWEIRPDRVCLVGSGPSLADTEAELRDLYFEGCKVVTMNGAYHWCVERNIRPSLQVVVDARASNARFLSPAVPQCRYMLASQCAPEAWDAVEGREHVWIFHATTGADPETRRVLDDYYGGNWYGVNGGVTVATRALFLLRLMGYYRYDIFGVDSCWMGDRHHAFSQQENERDQWSLLRAGPAGGPERVFKVTPWHLKQFEDMLQIIRLQGDEFMLTFHGDGLLAYAQRTLGAGEWSLDVPAAV